MKFIINAILHLPSSYPNFPISFSSHLLVHFIISIPILHSPSTYPISSSLILSTSSPYSIPHHPIHFTIITILHTQSSYLISTPFTFPHPRSSHPLYHHHHHTLFPIILSYFLTLILSTSSSSKHSIPHHPILYPPPHTIHFITILHTPSPHFIIIAILHTPSFYPYSTP